MEEVIFLGKLVGLANERLPTHAGVTSVCTAGTTYVSKQIADVAEEARGWGKTRDTVAPNYEL